MVSFYKNRKVLVTGGAGFIGSRLVKELVASGASVTVIDNLSSGRVSNLRSVLHKISFIRLDLKNKEKVESVLGLDFFVIFHLAAVSSVPWAERKPDLCQQTNVDAMQLVLDTLRAKSFKPIIVFSSSSSVYGERGEPSCENDPTNPASVYAKSKLRGEELLRQYSQDSGAPSFILRYYNVFSEDEDKREPSVFALFKKSLQENLPVNIFGTGEQVRDYVDLGKVVEATMKLPTCGLYGSHVFNVASGRAISVLDLLEQLKSRFCVEQLKVNFLPARDGDVFSSVAITSKLDEVLKNYKNDKTKSQNSSTCE